MDNIVIVGSSGHAKVVIDIVQKQGRYNITGLIDPYRSIDEQTLGYRILGKQENLPELKEFYSIQGVIVAIGDNFVRSRVAEFIRKVCPDISFVSAIHPNASIAADVSIGEGSVIMPGALINACTSIGRFCILNTNSSMDHDSIMQDYASLAPGVTTGGKCRIGEYSAVCIGSVLADGVHIGQHTVVGASSLVLKSLESFVTAYGMPAKKICDRQPGDQYL